MQHVEMKEVEFTVIKEDYSRFVLDDKVILRAKAAVKKIFFHPQKTPEGYPASVVVDTTNLVSSIVPEPLKRPPSPESWDPQKDRGEEVEFREQKIAVQEYSTPDGFQVTVKPAITKILKYKKFNDFGEPIYGVTMQAIINIKKTTGVD